MTTLSEKINQLGQMKDLTALKELIENQHIQQLQEVIVEKTNSPKLFATFSHILKGTSDKDCGKRTICIITMLKQLQLSTCTMQMQDLVTRLICSHAERLETKYMLDIFKFCLSCVQRGVSANTSWKDIIPHIIKTIVTKEQLITYSGEEMLATEFENQALKTLLVMDFSPDIVIPITMMFNQMNLNKEMHLQVLNKLASSINSLTVQEIPGFARQLLDFCSQYNLSIALFTLQQSFETRIYNNSSIEVNSDNLDALMTRGDQLMIQAESTVLLHIKDVGLYPSMKDYLNFLINMVKAPEHVFQPFQLTVLIILLRYDFLEDKIFEVFKTCLLRSLNEKQMISDSCWYREVVPTPPDIKNVFKQIIQFSISREYVITGLTNLSFHFLQLNAPFGKEKMYENIWDLANFILIKVIKHERSLFKIILNRLCDLLSTDQNAQKYVACFLQLGKDFGVMFLENAARIVRLLENSVHTSLNMIRDILHAILPLVKISTMVRDTIVMMLRKALYSNSHASSCHLGLAGFLKMLANMKISNLDDAFERSQSSSSISIFTQISLSVSRYGLSQAQFSNDALCLEMIGIMRRCFIQSVDIKEHFYDGLHAAVEKNPALSDYILERLLEHFEQYYNYEEGIMVPLNFDKITAIKDPDVIHIEPLAKLMYSMGIITVVGKKALTEEELGPTFEEVADKFDKVIQKLSQCELEHFEFDDGTDYTDILPESQKKVIVLTEAIKVYEAMIGYCVCVWRHKFGTKAKDIKALFDVYSRLIDFAKTTNKSKKGAKKKDANTTGTDSNSQKSDGSKGKQEKKRLFKLPETILTFPILEDMLNLLYKQTLDWATVEAANLLRRNVNFHRYTLTTINNLFAKTKSSKYIETSQLKDVYESCVHIGHTLYNRCVVRFKAVIDFDGPTAIQGLETFYCILECVETHFDKNWNKFLAAITDKSEDESLVISLNSVLSTYQDLVDSIDDSNDDAEAVKFANIVLMSIMKLGKLIPTTKNPLTESFMDWLKSTIQSKEICGKINNKNFIDFVLKFDIKHTNYSTLLKHLALQCANSFGVLSEEEINVPEEYVIVNDVTSKTILSSLCEVLNGKLNDIDSLMMRMKSEYAMVVPEDDLLTRRREIMRSNERNICFELCNIINILTILTDCQVPPGSQMEVLLKTDMHLYTTTTSLTKYFMQRSTKQNVVFKTAKFESVVKLAGKKLALAIDNLIQHIHDSTKRNVKESSSTKTLSSLKSRFLRETKLIPKIVYEREQFSKNVIMISKKTKVELTKLIRLGSTWDYRVNELANVMRAGEVEQESTQVTDGDITVDITREDDDNSSVSSVVDNDSSVTSEKKDEPVSKKRRKK